MFSQEEIDAVLKDAQQAVETLSNDVQTLAQPEPQPAAEQPAQATISPPPPAATTLTTSPDPSMADRLQRTLKLAVPLLVRLANQNMTIGEIMRIGPGTILEFGRTVDSELDLMINNAQIGKGIAVKVGEQFGLRITKIGNVKQRIDSLGPH